MIPVVFGLTLGINLLFGFTINRVTLFAMILALGLLVEAKELARHTDVNLTMRYTHIGLQDQAKALANLPAPKEEWQRIGSAFDGIGSHSETPTDKVSQGSSGDQESTNPCGSRGLSLSVLTRHW